MCHVYKILILLGEGVASLILKAHTPHQYTCRSHLRGTSIYYTGSYPLLVLSIIHLLILTPEGTTPVLLIEKCLFLCVRSDRYHLEALKSLVVGSIHGKPVFFHHTVPLHLHKSVIIPKQRNVERARH